MVDEWQQGNRLHLVRNPNYWQEGLPYLDSVEFRPIPDPQAREDSLRSGVVDAIATSNTTTALHLRDDPGDFTVIDDTKSTFGKEKTFVMLNTAVAPLDDVRVRRAMAMATDAERVRELIYDGIPPLVDGPFSEGSPFHPNDSGYPSFDPDGARALIEEYEAESGEPVAFEIMAPPSGSAAAQLFQAMWAEVGVDVEIRLSEQAQFITDALMGNYGAALFRQYGEVDPDQIFIYWHSATAAPVGELALNFGRFKDDEVDAALLQGRTSFDADARAEAYQTVARRFGDQVPFLWISENVWTLATAEDVHGVLDWTLPDGSAGFDSLLSGRFLVGHAWMSK
jgi:ABC-type transport system substrate-binding protein